MNGKCWTLHTSCWYTGGPEAAGSSPPGPALAFGLDKCEPVCIYDWALGLLWLVVLACDPCLPHVLIHIIALIIRG
jgi:hypothetical protein